MGEIRAALAMVFVLVLGQTGEGAAKPLEVTDVRIGQHGERTRFVLEMSDSSPYRWFTLSNPYRVVIDLPDVVWRLDPESLPDGGGLIETFRFGRFQPGTSRVVLDLRAPAQIHESFVLEPRQAFPHRFVLDLVPGDAAGFVRPANSAAPKLAMAPAEVPFPRMKPRSDRRRIIVLDAGHGGVDPGAIGRGGTHEKDIVLSMARELKARLEGTGRYRVELTRDRDTYLPLRERVKMGRRAGGDLFVSLHADSHPKADARGASVYTLSEQASDAEAAALAEKENKSDIIAGVDLTSEDSEVTNILIDLAQRETMNQSAVFARILVEELGERTRLLKRTHRFAGFAVLKAPDVPSVLIEMGYLSNREEERLLRSKRHRAAIAEAMAAAVDRFFAEQERLARS